MRRRDVERYRGQLESQLTSLLSQGGRAVHDMVREREGIADPNDRASAEEVRNSALRLRDRDRKLIGKIQGALSRLEDGTFGTCLKCGAPISAARLRARPVTDLCIACKTESERLER